MSGEGCPGWDKEAVYDAEIYPLMAGMLVDKIVSDGTPPAGRLN